MGIKSHTTTAAISLGAAISQTLQSIGCVKTALVAEEVSNSISAHIMMAIAIEGIINEFGELTIDTWTWEKLEKSEPSLKARVISNFKKKDCIKPGEQTLEFIQNIFRIRNKLVHPKMTRVGKDIFSTNDKKIIIDPPDDFPVSQVHTVYSGYKEIYDDFNAKSSYQNLIKTIDSIINLRDCIGIKGYEWFDDTKKEIMAIKPPRNNSPSP